jgi:hypothetical protein
MTALMAFLWEQVAEDKRAADAASPGPWGPKTPGDLRLGDFGWSFGSDAPGWDSERLAAEASDSEQGKADALFVGRFDPTRVLAEVAAKRALLRLVGAYVALARTLAEVAPGTPEEREARIRAETAMDALHALAQPYADRPGWNPAWSLDW